MLYIKHDSEEMPMKAARRLDPVQDQPKRDPSDPAWLLSDEFVREVQDHFTRAKTAAIRDLKAKGITPAG